jgi:dTDP-6-deoxy-L-talose 4-dehydrogenase (NAD+)
MKILLSGGTGTLGTALLNKLDLADHAITILTRAPKPNSKNITYLKWDLSEELIPDLDQREYDVLIHLAWEVLPQYNNTVHLTTILPNHIRFLNQIIENRIAKKLIISGTCFEYGKQYGELDEMQATFPNTPYGLAKDILRRFAMRKANKFDVSLFWLRIFYLNDGGLNSRALLGKIRKAAEESGSIDLSDCTQQLDYINSERILNLINTLIVTNRTKSQVINVSSGEATPLKAIIENFVSTENLAIQLNYGKIKKADYESDYCWGNNSRLKEIEKSG